MELSGGLISPVYWSNISCVGWKGSEIFCLKLTNIAGKLNNDKIFTPRTVVHEIQLKLNRSWCEHTGLKLPRLAPNFSTIIHSCFTGLILKTDKTTCCTNGSQSLNVKTTFRNISDIYSHSNPHPLVITISKL